MKLRSIRSFAALKLASLSRITSSDSVIRELEGLRFIAIVLVFLHHLGGVLIVKRPDLPITQAFSNLVWNGRFGVQLFFAISGFILSLRFARQHLGSGPKVKIGPYFTRRLTRLEPPYIINQVAMFCLLVAMGGSTLLLLPHLAATLIYGHGLLYGSHSAINGVGWSLEIEVQFYLLAPLLTKVFAIRSRVARLATIVSAGVCAMCLQDYVQADWVRFTFIGYFQYFLVGFILVDIYLIDWKERPARSAFWDVVSLAAWVSIAANLCGRPPDTISNWNFLLPVQVLLAYYSAFRGRWSSTALRNPWVVTFGGMCYTIYLYHFTMIIGLSRLTLRLGLSHSFLLNYLIQICLQAPVVFGISALLFRYTERPFMQRNWLSKLRGRVQAKALPMAA